MSEVVAFRLLSKFDKECTLVLPKEEAFDLIRMHYNRQGDLWVVGSALEIEDAALYPIALDRLLEVEDDDLICSIVEEVQFNNEALPESIFERREAGELSLWLEARETEFSLRYHGVGFTLKMPSSIKYEDFFACDC